VKRIKILECGTPLDARRASISSIDQYGLIVKSTKGKTCSILSPNLTYQNGNARSITEAQVNLPAGLANWSLTETPVPIPISGSGSWMYVTLSSGKNTLDWQRASTFVACRALEDR